MCATINNYVRYCTCAFEECDEKCIKNIIEKVGLNVTLLIATLLTASSV